MNEKVNHGHFIHSQLHRHDAVYNHLGAGRVYRVIGLGTVGGAGWGPVDKGEKMKSEGLSKKEKAEIASGDYKNAILRTQAELLKTIERVDGLEKRIEVLEHDNRKAAA